MQVEARHLDYFSEHEWIREGKNWLPMYNPKLPVMLDIFRHHTGPCILSPHPLALGRIFYNKNPRSMHIFDAEDGVRAVDCFPYTADLSDYPFGTNLQNNISTWLREAIRVGFNGFIVYPDWTYKGKKRCGVHLDIRPEPFHRISINGDLLSVEQGLEKI